MEDQRDSQPVRRDEAFAELEGLIRGGTACVGVIGLGSVGLPLAAAFVRAGFRVLGYDVDAERVGQLAAGRSPSCAIHPEVSATLFGSERFEASLDPERLSEVDAALICVPTPLAEDSQPDLACVRAASDLLAGHLAAGKLVVLESTTYPGTTREVVAGRLAEGGLELGRSVLLAYSPEREDPGRRDHTTRTIPKLVGGTCERSGELVQALYSQAVEVVVRVRSAEVAEAAKLFENTFRALNIALVNELKLTLEALDLDVWEVLEAAASKPFGFMQFSPGPGMGGHCLPVDPCYLEWVARRAGSDTPLVRTAREVNAAMPAHVVGRTLAALEERGTVIEGARILLLGLAYKADVDMVSESPTVKLFELFRERGARVSFSDPHVARMPTGVAPELSSRDSLELDAKTLAGFDAVVLATAHRAFDYDLIAAHARLVVDTRNALAARMQGSRRYLKA